MYLYVFRGGFVGTLTISISDDLKASMNEFDEINWSGFIRNKIKEKIELMELKKSIANKIDDDLKDGQFWANKLKEDRIQRIKELKSKGLL